MKGKKTLKDIDSIETIAESITDPTPIDEAIGSMMLHIRTAMEIAVNTQLKEKIELRDRGYSKKLKDMSIDNQLFFILKDVKDSQTYDVINRAIKEIKRLKSKDTLSSDKQIEEMETDDLLGGATPPLS